MPGCESRCTVLGEVLPGHPHALEGAQGGQDRAAYIAYARHILYIIYTCTYVREEVKGEEEGS